MTFPLCFIFCFLFDFLSSSVAAALATANARIASLKAELSASQKAYDIAAAAKASDEKSQKLALGKAKRAKKALADANKEQILREEAVTKHLCTMSTAAEGKCFTLSLYFDSCYVVILADTLLSSFVVPGLLGYPHRLYNWVMILC
jgi:hypothetical protein